MAEQKIIVGEVSEAHSARKFYNSLSCIHILHLLECNPSLKSPNLQLFLGHCNGNLNDEFILMFSELWYVIAFLPEITVVHDCYNLFTSGSNNKFLRNYPQFSASRSIVLYMRSFQEIFVTKTEGSSPVLQVSIRNHLNRFYITKTCFSKIRLNTIFLYRSLYTLSWKLLRILRIFPRRLLTYWNHCQHFSLVIFLNFSALQTHCSLTFVLLTCGSRLSHFLFHDLRANFQDNSRNSSLVIRFQDLQFVSQVLSPEVILVTRGLAMKES